MSQPQTLEAPVAPEPEFRVLDARGRRHAAVPAIEFDVHVSEPGGRAVYVIALSATLHALYAGTDISNPAFRWTGLLALGLVGFFTIYRVLAPAESRGRNSTGAANTRRYAAHLQAQGPQPPDWL